MTYSPAGHGCGGFFGKLTEIELAGIKALIKKWCGIDIHLIDAGPCVSDPIGDIAHYISIRDGRGNAVAVGVDADGTILKVQQNHMDARK